jgi:putative copper resistance protein D
MELLDLVSVVLRAGAFIATLQAAGLAWFLVPCRGAGAAAMASVNRLLRISALLALVLVVTHRGLDAGRLAGEWSGVLDPHLQGMVWSRRPGLSSIVCALGLLMLLIASAGRSIRWAGYAGTVGALGLAGSFALTGHTTEASHAVALRALVAVHVGLAAYWIGAVAGLYRLTRRSNLRAVANAAARFSATAVWLVPVILPAGALLIWGLIPDLAALYSVYGGLLLAKALGFGGLILLAARNRRRRVPALVTGAPGSMQSFQRVLCAEYVLLCGVLSVTATMTALFSWQ